MGASPDLTPKGSNPDLTPTSPGFSLRPDANGRVDELARRDGTSTGHQSLASQGWERYQKGDLEGASALLGKAIAEPDAKPWVRYAYGYSELGIGHPQLAATEWEKVRTAAPDFEPVYLDLADAYMQMTNYGRALDVLKAASARWPDNTEILNAAGTIQVRRGALDQAISTFRKATDNKPDEALGYFNLARTYELRYLKTRRYSQSEQRWLANSVDLKQALAGYEAYLKLGGPYETEARQAIQNLQWFK
jgi:predicted Zn-dependent protease